ncbi:MAG TPA: hypothetical protein VGD14_01090 [bacterium]
MKTHIPIPNISKPPPPPQPPPPVRKRKAMKRIPLWIKIKYFCKPPLFVCDRCGDTRELHLPDSIDGAVKQGEAFTETHKYCRENTVKKNEKKTP